MQMLTKGRHASVDEVKIEISCCFLFCFIFLLLRFGRMCETILYILSYLDIMMSNQRMFRSTERGLNLLS